MKKKLLKLLGEYKVIGDTTYGLGFKESEELVGKIIDAFIKNISTHKENEGEYCDTGEDMEWGCRSKCVYLAVKRIEE